MKAVEISAKWTRRESPCALCGKPIAANVLVHVHANRAAHIGCNLERLDREFRARREAMR